jgi:superoxide dismutase
MPDGRMNTVHGLPSCSKHHAVYVKGVNDALAKHPELKDLDLVTLNKYAGTDKIPSDIATPVRNHGRWKVSVSCDRLWNRSADSSR